MIEAATLPPRSLIRTLFWAAYLACSWTWCIGMFLPVLLVRDYGAWGFVAFALPNVIGAAAMGWVLRDGVSQRLITQHRVALRAFSLITIAFQGAFFFRLVGDNPLANAPLVALFIALPFTRALGFGASPVVWLLSIAMLLTAWMTGSDTASPSITLGNSPGILFLAPVCTFGFLLCPYLDLTFHRARQSLSAPDARTAFTIGFGVLFAAMILGTLSYAPIALAFLTTGGELPRPLILPARWISLHIAMQLVFTIAVHRDELLRPPQSFKQTAWELIITACIVVAIVALSRAVGSDSTAAHPTAMLTNEIAYRLFMSFYGLIFPAYVWLCMIPTADSHSGIAGPRGRRKLIALAIATTLAAPCYWMGFIERHELWLVPGLGIVLLARLFVRQSAAPHPVPAAASRSST